MPREIAGLRLEIFEVTRLSSLVYLSSLVLATLEYPEPPRSKGVASIALSKGQTTPLLA